MTRKHALAAVVVVAVVAAGPTGAVAAADAPGSPAGASPSLQAANETNVTVGTLTVDALGFRNTTVRNVRADLVELAGVNVGGAVPLPILADETLRDASAASVRIGEATMTNVTMENVTVRNGTVAEALDLQATGTVENHTVENATLSGLVIDGAAIANATADEVSIRGFNLVEAVPPGTAGPPALEVGNADVGDLAVTDATVVLAGNATAPAARP